MRMQCGLYLQWVHHTSHSLCDRMSLCMCKRTLACVSSVQLRSISCLIFQTESVLDHLDFELKLYNKNSQPKHQQQQQQKEEAQTLTLPLLHTDAEFTGDRTTGVPATHRRRVHLRRNHWGLCYTQTQSSPETEPLGSLLHTDAEFTGDGTTGVSDRPAVTRAE